MRKQFYIKPSFSGYEFSKLMLISSKLGYITTHLIGRHVGPSINLDEVLTEYLDKVSHYSRQRKLEGCKIKSSEVLINEIKDSCKCSNSFDSITISINGKQITPEY